MPSEKAKPYGFDITYRTFRGETFTFHRVTSSETTARKFAALKPHFKEVVSLEPLTREQWVRAYGDPSVRT